MSDEDQTSTVLEAARAALIKDGWCVELRTRSGSFELHLEHPLSGSNTIHFRTDEPEPAGRLRTILDAFEFTAIRCRPSRMPQEALIGSLRQAARSLRWNAQSLSILSRVLAGHGVLSLDEARWLEYAGASWSDPDGKEASEEDAGDGLDTFQPAR